MNISKFPTLKYSIHFKPLSYCNVLDLKSTSGPQNSLSDTRNGIHLKLHITNMSILSKYLLWHWIWFIGCAFHAFLESFFSCWWWEFLWFRNSKKCQIKESYVYPEERAERQKCGLADWLQSKELVNPVVSRIEIIRTAGLFIDEKEPKRLIICTHSFQASNKHSKKTKRKFEICFLFWFSRICFCISFKWL